MGSPCGSVENKEWAWKKKNLPIERSGDRNGQEKRWQGQDGRGSTDVNQPGSPDDRRSTLGYCVFNAGNTIS